ncbi:alpha/beta hydrolase [Cryobacterium sp. 1639]|uniref:alpha/beta fold hydrolase n=1 Tax=Cryobacterium inferilacus TaxID=2866629 RepID=UPI001C72D59C|nr:alpha/beta hydrolase [Cryobacterium sp. 1639]MBX0300108.1 alpha/beta hydrolase [Cryobacterium sp. 1639]
MRIPTAEPVTIATETDYSPFPLGGDPTRWGLHTSLIPTALGPVTVRHGRAGGPVATILLHGAAGSWTTWTPVLEAADQGDAAPLRDVVIPDLPGWGDTPLPEDAATETIQALAVDVADIAQFLGYQRWRVIGHSLGGFVALELAASAPDRTEHVGLVSATTYGVIASARQPWAGLAVLPGFTGLLGVMRALAGLRDEGRGLVGALHRRGLMRALVAPLFAHTDRIDATVVDALAAEARPRAFALAAALAGRYDADRSWARIVCPVRAVHGDRDVFVTTGDDRRMAAVIADFAVTELADTGHFGHIERPLAALRGVWPARP